MGDQTKTVPPQQLSPPPPPAYAAPAPGYSNPGMLQQGQTVVINTTGLPSGHMLMFGDVPQNMQCQFCQAQIITRTEKKLGTMVWLVAGVMILLGLWLCCCFIPFCIPALYDVVHYCPNCNRQLGVKERLK